MRNKILFCATLFAFCTLSTNINAQLEVDTSGDVEMSKNVTIAKKLAVNGASLTNTATVNVFTNGINHNGAIQYGLRSHLRIMAPYLISSGCGIGVYGSVSSSGATSTMTESTEQTRSLPFYAGVAGTASSGVGIYGSNGTLPSPSTSWTEGNYAGYFVGDIKVTGLINGVTVSNSGDSRLHENVAQLSNRNTDDLFLQLNPVSFTMRHDSAQTDTKATTVTHYGFVAQELQQIAPELVLEDGAGYLSINYMELIPLLVQKVQELSAEVDELKGQINENK